MIQFQIEGKAPGEWINLEMGTYGLHSNLDWELFTNTNYQSFEPFTNTKYKSLFG